jgi:hypothetical protein
MEAFEVPGMSAMKTSAVIAVYFSPKENEATPTPYTNYNSGPHSFN